MFADADNRQLPTFWSRWRCRGSAGRCAFRQSWEGKNLFVNPPFVLIAKVVAEAQRRQQMTEENARVLYGQIYNKF